jgi:hypothetical protein
LLILSKGQFQLSSRLSLLGQQFTIGYFWAIFRFLVTGANLIGAKGKSVEENDDA